MRRSLVSAACCALLALGACGTNKAAEPVAAAPETKLAFVKAQGFGAYIGTLSYRITLTDPKDSAQRATRRASVLLDACAKAEGTFLQDASSEAVAHFKAIAECVNTAANNPKPELDAKGKLVDDPPPKFSLK